jgi:hypothetical protein
MLNTNVHLSTEDKPVRFYSQMLETPGKKTPNLSIRLEGGFVDVYMRAEQVPELLKAIQELSDLVVAEMVDDNPVGLCKTCGLVHQPPACQPPEEEVAF